MSAAAGPGRDAYLTRLDAVIRRLAGQQWNDEAARQHRLAGLTQARELYVRPGLPRRGFAAGLRAALSGPLPDEPPDPGLASPQVTVSRADLELLTAAAARLAAVLRDARP